MWFSTPSGARAGRSTSLRTLLAVEPLEDRAVPANFTAATVADLIAAVSASNETPEADTLTLHPATTFTLTAVNNATQGPTGLPTVVGTGLTIVGNGSVIERSTARWTSAFRLFSVAAGASLTLENLTLQGGLAYDYAAGGAIYNGGTLTLDVVTVQNNTARGSDSWSDGGSAVGGGIYSTGSLTISASTIRNNAAIGGRGGVGRGPDDSGCAGSCPNHHVAGNGGAGLGGGLFVAGGTATLRTTSVTDNVARGGAGAGAGGNDGRGSGGGLFIFPAAWVGIDAFTESHVRLNKASTSDNDIAGTYEVIS